MSGRMITLQSVQDNIRRGEQGDRQAWETALADLYHVLNQDPSSLSAQYLLSNMYIKMGRPGVAISMLKQVLFAIKDQKSKEDAENFKDGRYSGVLESEAWSNLAIASKECGNRIEAIASLNYGLRLSPDDVDMLNNLGTMYINEAEPEKAEEYFRGALSIDPCHKHSNWNLGLALLEQGKWEEGFQKYRYGMLTGDRYRKPFNTAIWWQGQKTDSIVIYDEQGVGDSVMYASLYHRVIDLVDRVVIECHPRLEALMKRSFPSCAVFGTRKEKTPEKWINEYEKENGKIKHKISSADIPAFFIKQDSDFNKEPYLVPNEDLVKKYTAELNKYPGPYLGFSFVGGSTKTRKDLRTIRLVQFEDFFKRMAASGTTIISCDYTDRSEEYAKLKERTGVEVIRFPKVFEGGEFQRYRVYVDLPATKEQTIILPDMSAPKTVPHCLGEFKDKNEAKHVLHQAGGGGRIEHIEGPGFDLDDFVAFLVAIHRKGGIIASVNNSTVHFCGAAGVNCITFTPRKAAWRYGLSQSGMPWYGSNVVQYREAESADGWNDTIALAADDIIDFLKC